MTGYEMMQICKKDKEALKRFLDYVTDGRCDIKQLGKLYYNEAGSADDDIQMSSVQAELMENDRCVGAVFIIQSPEINRNTTNWIAMDIMLHAVTHQITELAIFIYDDCDWTKGPVAISGLSVTERTAGKEEKSEFLNNCLTCYVDAQAPEIQALFETK